MNLEMNMKKILFVALVFLFTGCASYLHDGSRHDRRPAYHEDGRGADNDREHLRDQPHYR